MTEDNKGWQYHIRFKRDANTTAKGNVIVGYEVDAFGDGDAAEVEHIAKLMAENAKTFADSQSIITGEVKP
jgi:hypothetical protein